MTYQDERLGELYEEYREGRIFKRCPSCGDLRKYGQKYCSNCGIDLRKFEP